MGTWPLHFSCCAHTTAIGTQHLEQHPIRCHHTPGAAMGTWPLHCSCCAHTTAIGTPHLEQRSIRCHHTHGAAMSTWQLHLSCCMCPHQCNWNPTPGAASDLLSPYTWSCHGYLATTLELLWPLHLSCCAHTTAIGTPHLEQRPIRCHHTPGAAMGTWPPLLSCRAHTTAIGTTHLEQHPLSPYTWSCHGYLATTLQLLCPHHCNWNPTPGAVVTIHQELPSPHFSCCAHTTAIRTPHLEQHPLSPYTMGTWPPLLSCCAHTTAIGTPHLQQHPIRCHHTPGAAMGTWPLHFSCCAHTTAIGTPHLEQRSIRCHHTHGAAMGTWPLHLSCCAHTSAIGTTHLEQHPLSPYTWSCHGYLATTLKLLCPRH